MGTHPTQCIKPDLLHIADQGMGYKLEGRQGETLIIPARLLNTGRALMSAIASSSFPLDIWVHTEHWLNEVDRSDYALFLEDAPEELSPQLQRIWAMFKLESTRSGLESGQIAWDFSTLVAGSAEEHIPDSSRKRYCVESIMQTFSGLNRTYFSSLEQAADQTFDGINQMVWHEQQYRFNELTPQQLSRSIPVNGLINDLVHARIQEKKGLIDAMERFMSTIYNDL